MAHSHGRPCAVRGTGSQAALARRPGAAWEGRASELLGPWKPNFVERTWKISKIWATICSNSSYMMLQHISTYCCYLFFLLLPIILLYIYIYVYNNLYPIQITWVDMSVFNIAYIFQVGCVERRCRKSPQVAPSELIFNRAIRACTEEGAWQVPGCFDFRAQRLALPSFGYFWSVMLNHEMASLAILRTVCSNHWQPRSSVPRGLSGAASADVQIPSDAKCDHFQQHLGTLGSGGWAIAWDQLAIFLFKDVWEQFLVQTWTGLGKCSG